MAGRVFGSNGSQAAVQASGAGDGSIDGSSSQRGDHELRRMAAFRVREAANRIAVLANSAQSDGLRASLLAICERLVAEERALLDSLASRGDA